MLTCIACGQQVARASYTGPTGVVAPDGYAETVTDTAWICDKGHVEDDVDDDGHERD